MEFKMMLWLQQLQANYNLISIHKKQEFRVLFAFSGFWKTHTRKTKVKG